MIKSLTKAILFSLLLFPLAASSQTLLRNSATTNQIPVAAFVTGTLTNNTTGNAATATSAGSSTTATYVTTSPLTNATDATKLVGIAPSTAMPALTGEITNSAGTVATGLRAVGTSGTYVKVTTDQNGRVTNGLTQITGSDISGTLTNNTTGNASTSTFVTTSPLTNATDATKLSGVILPSNTATGVTEVAGPFLTTNGTANSFSYNAGGHTNLTGANVVGAVASATTATWVTGNNTTLTNATDATKLVGTVPLANIPTGQVLTNNETQATAILAPLNISGQLTLTNSQKAYFGTTSTTNITIDGGAGANINVGTGGSPSAFNSGIQVDHASGAFNGGNVAINAITTKRTVVIDTGAASVVGETITGRASQTGDLQQWINSTPTLMASVRSNGVVTTTGGFASFKNNAAAPTSITVGASVFNYTNTQLVNIQVFLDANGATTAVTFNGTAIFSSLVAGDHTIILQPGDRIGVTYSVATPIMNYREF